MWKDLFRIVTNMESPEIEQKSPEDYAAEYVSLWGCMILITSFYVMATIPGTWKDIPRRAVVKMLRATVSLILPAAGTLKKLQVEVFGR